MEQVLFTPIGVLAVALLLDQTLGEYPTPLHTVVWLGNLVNALLRLAPGAGWWRQFLFGAALTAGVVAGSAAAVWWLLRLAAAVPLLTWLASVYLLKASFALRELGAAAERVRTAVAADDLPAARAALRSLCSRDPSQLDGEALLAAAVQSLAENASDSFVAPLFYYLPFGVPGAVAYRAINTLDAMIGYRGKYEALGKAAARLDDLANFIPARLTAYLLLLAGWLHGRRISEGWRVLRRDAAYTPSPNGGRPMAVLAGLLGVRLEKPGAYALGDALRPLTPAVAREAWQLVALASWLAAGLAALVLVAVNFPWRWL
jgi:adenosylcobinamide-phosphate synthase